MKLIGLTGNIASGKSTVLSALQAKGAEILDADRLVHSLLGAGTPSSARVVETFGLSVRNEDGSINRAALGAIVFADADKLKQLEAILHPAVGEAIRARIAEAACAPNPPPAFVVEAVKLVESGTYRILDQLWLVVADPAIQHQRMITDRGMSPADADARLAAQPDLAFKMSLAHAILNNNGTRADLLAQVDQAWATLVESDNTSAQSSPQRADD